MPFFDHGGIRFHYLDAGSGTPFIFQHGLGGNVHQPEGLYEARPGFRFIAMDSRGHGETRPIGEAAKLGFETFGDDVLALMGALGLERAIVGGISLGAGVALNFVLRNPEHALGLVMSRPAWLDGPMLDNARRYSLVASLLRQHGPREGQALFKQSEEYAAVREASPDAAISLVGQFDDPRAVETVARLERLPNDAPNRSAKEWAAIQAPTLVLATRQDPIHPFEYGEKLARAIPSAVFMELTPKSVSQERYRLETRAAIDDFLQANFGQ